MSREDYPYDEDEFDVLGADRTPQGVHRAPVPRWRQLLPFAIVIVLAPLLAWAGVSALSGEFGSDPQDTPPAVTEPEDDDGEQDDPDGTEPEPDEGEGNDDGADDPGENGTDEGDENGNDEGTEEDPADDPVDLDRDVRILILNGSTTVGLAGGAAETLNAEGWTNTETSDYGQAQPTVTTLYYHDSAVAEEAEAIAADLGIEATVESASAASSGVVIVLRQDYVG